MTLESMVESLNAELMELSSSDALTRAKQHHESVVASMRQKYDADILAANEKIDSLTKRLAEKVKLHAVDLISVKCIYTHSSP